MNRRNGWGERIKRIQVASGAPLDETDLPNGNSDAFTYFTDEEGEWNHEEYGRVLLERRGTAGPAWVGLRELDELQENLTALEERYLRLWELIDEDQFSRVGADRREFELLANQIANGEYVDRGIIDSIRAQLLVLGEIDLDVSDNDSD